MPDNKEVKCPFRYEQITQLGNDNLTIKYDACKLIGIGHYFKHENRCVGERVCPFIPRKGR